MEGQNRYYAYLHLSGDFDPVAVTAAAGVVPSRSWKRGDPWKPGRDRHFSSWALESVLPQSEPLEAHLRDVLRQMDAHEAAFLELTRTYDFTIELVGYFDQRYPGLFFEASLVSHLAKYRLSIDFDFYEPDRP